MKNVALMVNVPQPIRFVVGLFVSAFLIIISPLLALLVVDWKGLAEEVGGAISDYFVGIAYVIHSVFTRNTWFTKPKKVEPPVLAK